MLELHQCPEMSIMFSAQHIGLCLLCLFKIGYHLVQCVLWFFELNVFLDCYYLMINSPCSLCTDCSLLFPFAEASHCKNTIIRDPSEAIISSQRHVLLYVIYQGRKVVKLLSFLVNSS